MTDKITQTIAAVQDIVSTLTPAIAYNPDAPADTSLTYPFVFAFPSDGSIDINAGWFDMPTTILVDFHLARNPLATAAQQAWEYILPFAAALTADPTLGGAVAELNSATWHFGSIEWNQGVVDVGVRFTLVVKYNS